MYEVLKEITPYGARIGFWETEDLIIIAVDNYDDSIDHRNSVEHKLIGKVNKPYNVQNYRRMRNSDIARDTSRLHNGESVDYNSEFKNFLRGVIWCMEG